MDVVLAHIAPERLKADRTVSQDMVNAARALGKLAAGEAYHWRVNDHGADLVRGPAPEDDA